MRAAVHPSPGEVRIVEHADPIVGAHDVLVAVAASGMNRADLLQRGGRYQAPPGWPDDIPGLEFAGRVIETGAEVTMWAQGDRVMGLAGGGAHAELIALDQRELVGIPSNVDDVTAAAIPEAFFTAWDAICLQGLAQRGDRVLMHAIGSGVGTAAAQLSRRFNLTLVGTSRTADKLERCKTLGMTHGVNTSDADWVQQVGGQVKVIVDTLGAAVLAENLSLLADGGRLIVLGTMTGAIASQFDLGQVLRRRLRLLGTAMRVRSHDERVGLVERFTREVLPGFADGTLVPVVDSVFDAVDIAAAYDALASNGTFGKVLVRWGTH